MRGVRCGHVHPADRQLVCSHTRACKLSSSRVDSGPFSFSSQHTRRPGCGRRCPLALAESRRPHGATARTPEVCAPGSERACRCRRSGQEDSGGDDPTPSQVSAVRRPALHSRFSSESCGPHRNGWNVTELDRRSDRPTAVKLGKKPRIACSSLRACLGFSLSLLPPSSCRPEKRRSTSMGG